jgi:hypothetical protein
MNSGLRIAGCLGIISSIATIISPRVGLADDHFLTIGGGNWAQSTQASLEKNVHFFEACLASIGVPADAHEILFASGRNDSRDVQFLEPQKPLPKLNRLLAQVFEQERDVSASYRTIAIQHLWGAATRDDIRRWFNTKGKRLSDGDRLFIYFTGHGDTAIASPHESRFTIWYDQGMPVTEFAQLLDTLPAKVSVVLVMVQCHAGGFANVLFEGGDSSAGLSNRNRCGFFAAPHDRMLHHRHQ